MKRRIFLQQTGLIAGAAVVAPSLISAGKKSERLVILHTNDTHSNIDPFPANHAKYPNMGGVVRRAKAIQQVKQQEEHVLVLDAGDIFQGTPYFNKFKGVLEMKSMAEMGYDVVTLGNHDFDLGMDAYRQAWEHARFQVVNANYDLSGTPLADLVTPSTIIKKGRFKIGIFGVGVNLKGLVHADNWKGMTYQDPIAAAQKQADYLRKKRCNVVICLSHLGYEYTTDQVSDQVLAKQTSGIDVIIGGHTHTFLEELKQFTNKEGKAVFVNQVGYGGLKLGRIDIELVKSKQTGSIAATPISMDEKFG